MGCDPDAIGLIGIKIPTNKIFKKKKVKEFEHDYPENMNFDPVTGHKLWYTERVSTLVGYDDMYDGTYKDFFVDWSDCGGGDPKYLYFGALFAKADCDNTEQYLSLCPEDITSAEEKLKKEFEPLGLWDASKFGLHVLFKYNC